MNRPTLAQFRAQWPAEAMGICNSDPKVAQYCNDAQDRLLMDPLAPDGGWWGGWVRFATAVTVSNGSAYITLPRDFAAITDIALCGAPIHLHNGFYEFLSFSPGIQPKTCAPWCSSTLATYERDNVPTLSPLNGGLPVVRIYPTDTRDVGKRVLLQGKDSNGLPVTTTDPGTGRTALGEYLSLAMPFVNSAYAYSEITGIQKDETWGRVVFYQVDPSTGDESPLSSMDSSETTAAYRRYAITAIPALQQTCCNTSAGTAQITAIGRLDFVPVVNDTDYLIIPNIPALIEESLMLRFNRMDSTSGAQQAALHHQRAISLLNGQLDKYMGKVNTAVNVPLFGSQPLTRQPV